MLKQSRRINHHIPILLHVFGRELKLIQISQQQKMAKYHHIPILTEKIQKHLSCLSFFLCADANLQMY